MFENVYFINGTAYAGKRLECKDIFDVDLTLLDPVIYSGKYHSLGEKLGEIGDFLPTEQKK